MPKNLTKLQSMEQPAQFLSEMDIPDRAQFKDKTKYPSLLAAEMAAGRRRKRNLR